MISSLSMSGRKRHDYLKRQADIIAYTQRKKAAARKSHRKAALRRLHQIGINISCLPRCQRE
jgi:hypothetical protein